MADPVLLDNDVVLKLCCYGCHQLLDRLVDAPPAMLRVARYALRDRVRRGAGILDRERAKAALEGALAGVTPLDPCREEIDLAAELEEKATRASLDLDIGESQLLAILLRRNWPLLLTGDKRAVVAIHELAVPGANGRVACLEQAIATLIELVGAERLRAAVCAEPGADRAVTACMACSAEIVRDEDVRAGLSSYLQDLRRRSGSVLVLGDGLSG